MATGQRSLAGLVTNLRVHAFEDPRSVFTSSELSHFSRFQLPCAFSHSVALVPDDLLSFSSLRFLSSIYSLNSSISPLPHSPEVVCTTRFSALSMQGTR